MRIDMGVLAGVHQRVAGGCIWHGHVGRIEAWVGLAQLGCGHERVGALCCVRVGALARWRVGASGFVDTMARWHVGACSRGRIGTFGCGA